MTYLFYEYDRFSLQENIKIKVLNEVSHLTEQQLTGTKLEEWEEYFENKYFVDVPKIDRDGIHLDMQDAKVDARLSPDRHFFRDTNRPVYVDGNIVTVFIPFSGDSKLFRCSGNSIYHSSIEANITSDQLNFQIQQLDQDSEKLNSQIEKNINMIEGFLVDLEKQFKQFNDSIKQLVRNPLSERLEKFKKDNEIKSKLKFPLKQRSNAPKTYTSPQVRKKISTPTPKKTKTDPLTPIMDDADYNQILKICYDMTSVMEKSPHAFKEMGEEDIRQHFLVQLNGQYQGNATGETFNYEGKTDILVKDNGKNIFIGECKFWKGPNTVHETIDQLLGYSSWKDTKTAIYLFSRNKNFTEVLKQIPELVKFHENFVSQQNSVIDNETEFRFKFKHRDDNERLLDLTFLVFNVPK